MSMKIQPFGSAFSLLMTGGPSATRMSAKSASAMRAPRGVTTGSIFSRSTESRTRRG